MKIAVLAITEGAVRLGETLAHRLKADLFPCKGSLKTTLTKVWQEYEGIVCIMATGIVVRTIAPLMEDKQSDPAIVVCDETGQFAVSLLSGHLGGANDLARTVAKLSNGQPVITTASDVLGRTALDIWCRKYNLRPGDKVRFTQVMGKLVDTGSLTLYSRYPVPELPPECTLVDDPLQADLVITSRMDQDIQGVLLFPQSLVIGIGCKRGTSALAIEEAVLTACDRKNLAPQAIASLASIVLKKDEQGLLEYAENKQLSIKCYTSEELNRVPNIAPSSPTVQKITGAKAVAEPAALLAANTKKLLVAKIKHPGVTTAIAELVNPL